MHSTSSPKHVCQSDGQIHKKSHYAGPPNGALYSVTVPGTLYDVRSSRYAFISTWRSQQKKEETALIKNHSITSEPQETRPSLVAVCYRSIGHAGSEIEMRRNKVNVLYNGP